MTAADVARQLLKLLSHLGGRAIKRRDTAFRVISGSAHSSVLVYTTRYQFSRTQNHVALFHIIYTTRDIARFVPEDRLLIETDAPYLAPVPHRGRPNEPSYVPLVAQCLADVRGVPWERIADTTARNFFTLFKEAA